MTDSDEVKPLPCPGCNEDAGNNLFVDRNAEGWWRYNCECGWSGPLMRTKKDSFLAWNTRPPVVTDEVVERVLREALDLQGGSCAEALQDGKVVPDTSIYWFYGHQIDVPALARAALASMPAVVSGGQST